MHSNRWVLAATLLLVAGLATVAVQQAGAAVPYGTRVAVSAAATTAGVDAHLHRGATISGTITSAATGKPVFALLVAYAAGRPVGYAFTAADGHYKIKGLAGSSTGYAVCAGGAGASGASATGYVGRCCYQDAAWKGGSIPGPRVARWIHAWAGRTRGDINVRLRVGGRISGAVTRFGTTVPLRGVRVALFAPNGARINTTYTGATGGYAFDSISPAPARYGYYVCFSAREVGATGFRPQCYRAAG